MRILAVVLALVVAGCYGYPRGGPRAHHVMTDIGVGGSQRRLTGIHESPAMSAVASSSGTATGAGVRWLTPSGHGGGLSVETVTGSGRPGFRVKAFDATYAYERNVGDGAVSLVGFAGPSRTQSRVTNYCYYDPRSIIPPLGSGCTWPPPPDLHDYDQLAWGAVAGLTAGLRAGILLVSTELAWRATRPTEDSPVGWNHVVTVQLRIGLDIAVAQ